MVIPDRHRFASLEHSRASEERDCPWNTVRTRVVFMSTICTKYLFKYRLGEEVSTVTPNRVSLTVIRKLASFRFKYRPLGES